MMTRKFLQLAMVAAGAAVTLSSVSACSDDSTATAPITSNPVTTTSMYSTQASESGATSQTSSAGASTAASGDASSPSTQPGGALPATAPDSRTSVPKSYPGPSTQPLSDKSRAYLAALKAQNVTFMGDTDNTVALTMAQYVCAERRKGTDPVTVKAFVTASVGPGTKTVVEANAKADKVIKAADDNYC